MGILVVDWCTVRLSVHLVKWNAVLTQQGLRNTPLGGNTSGLDQASWMSCNATEPELIELAIGRREGQLSASGALCVTTGRHTGRAAKDKVIVKDALTADCVWWDANRSLSSQQFDTLLDDFRAHMRGREFFVQDLYGAADKRYQLPTRVICEKAWHALYIRHLMIRPEGGELAAFAPQLTIVNLPTFRADPARHGCRSETVIAMDFTRQMVLIGGTAYAGEMKKSVFTMLNFLLPRQGVMAMHCSANAGQNGDTALFFGLSGTGKTTLSADPERRLIGDDEHGWGDDGVFNFEGGCYAKTIRLSAASEPAIYGATQRFATVLENVPLDETTRQPDFDDDTLTENGRCAYPLHYIANASPASRGRHPSRIIFLTADAFGVMPPIARLSKDQAMYHFLSGYTAKVAGTEADVVEPQATFSTCFGAPFMPLKPCVYGELLRDKMTTHGVTCWLLNTGWTGGPFRTGARMPLDVTRQLLACALDGSFDTVPMRRDPIFGFDVPQACEGIDNKLLTPRRTWADVSAYDRQASQLAQMFVDNFKDFSQDVGEGVRAAGPVIDRAREV